MGEFDAKFALLAGSTLFAIIDPIGCVPVYVAITAGFSRRRRRAVALRAVVASFAVLVFFAVTGMSVFRWFGVTLEAVRIAGGLIFLAIGWELLQGTYSATSHSEEDQQRAKEMEDPSITPLAIPLISGPGAIASTIVFMGQASGAVEVLTLIGVIAVVLAGTFVALILGDAIAAKVGPVGLRVVTRLMGLAILVIAVQLLIDGLTPVVRNMVGGA